MLNNHLDNIQTTTGNKLRFDYNNVPAFFKELDIFLLFKLDENGKVDKCPYQSNGWPGSSTDKSTWCSFENALAAYKTGKFAGIGVAILEGLVCVDLDKLFDKETGKWHPFGVDILARVPGVKRFSSSGTGAHIYGICTKHFFRCSHQWVEHGAKLGIEIFTDKRFMAMTDLVIDGSAEDIDDITDEVEAVFNEYVGKHHLEDLIVSSPRHNSDIDIDDRLRLAYQSSSGAKIKRLMTGDLTLNDDNHSKADLALCCHLAFWLGNDPGLIEEAFNRSLLANRDKWLRRKYYRDKTISKAIAKTHTVFGDKQ